MHESGQREFIVSLTLMKASFSNLTTYTLLGFINRAEPIDWYRCNSNFPSRCRGCRSGRESGQRRGRETQACRTRGRKCRSGVMVYTIVCRDVKKMGKKDGPISCVFISYHRSIRSSSSLRAHRGGTHPVLSRVIYIIPRVFLHLTRDSLTLLVLTFTRSPLLSVKDPLVG